MRTGAHITALGICLAIAGGCVTSIENDGEGAELEEMGLVLQNGLSIDNGLKLTNGAILSNGIKLTNGVNLATGLDPLNGVDLTAGAPLGPAIAPPPGSGLELWIDVDPDNQLRLLQYLVQCALPATASVKVTYRGATAVYGGSAGLGPGLQGGTMSSAEQEKVTACLLARVNAQHKTVVIDMFGPMAGMDFATSAELAAFSVQEGTFFGNLFLGDWSQAYACGLEAISQYEFRACDVYGCGLVVPLSEDISGPYVSDRGTDLVLRDCYGDKICARKSLGGGHAYSTSCSAGGVTWRYPITTNLRPAGAGEECYGSYQCSDGLFCSSGLCQ